MQFISCPGKQQHRQQKMSWLTLGGEGLIDQFLSLNNYFEICSYILDELINKTLKRIKFIGKIKCLTLWSIHLTEASFLIDFLLLPFTRQITILAENLLQK